MEPLGVSVVPLGVDRLALAGQMDTAIPSHGRVSISGHHCLDTRGISPCHNKEPSLIPYNESAACLYFFRTQLTFVCNPGPPLKLVVMFCVGLASRVRNSIPGAVEVQQSR